MSTNGESWGSDRLSTIKQLQEITMLGIVVLSLRCVQYASTLLKQYWPDCPDSFKKSIAILTASDGRFTDIKVSEILKSTKDANEKLNEFRRRSFDPRNIKLSQKELERAAPISNLIKVVSYTAHALKSASFNEFHITIENTVDAMTALGKLDVSLLKCIKQDFDLLYHATKVNNWTHSSIEPLNIFDLPKF